MKRSQRVASLIKILTDSPNTLFGLQYFCTLFDAAKSSISEDIKEASRAILETGTGYLETIPGKKGGVKFIPDISDESIRELQEEFCKKLCDPSRLLGGNFLYTSDIFYNPVLMTKSARVFAKKFRKQEADCVVTLETKGIPLAFSVAKELGLPLVVIRRDAKISEGSTISINYFSGSEDRLQKMTMSKRALKPNSKVIIIDDFMRAGGSIVGIKEMVNEFNCEVVAIGVAIVSVLPEKKKIKDYTAICYLGNVSTDERIIEVMPNYNI
ncbi:MAG: pur operon repressor [Clostridia bacterium]|nr:pur operon repressor [Clostridia bacterium]